MRKYFILISLILVGLTSCKDYLDVSSDSKYEEDYVFGTKEEINRVLTSVYASLMSNDTYGNAYFATFALNSDVEFTAFSNSIRSVNGEDFRCFDGTQHGSSVRKFWDKEYEGIERANLFIDGIQNSPVYSEDDIDLTQQLGEAKVLRAMFYHDLVVMFGDVPFTTEPSIKLESLAIPMTDRNEILTYLINDLIGAAPGMKYAASLPDGVERASREFCYGMIARMALTRGGYALYPDKGNPMSVGTMQRQDDYKDYYAIAMQYADLVISSATHALNKSFRQVFIDQCNNIVSNNDDPIFEIPFLRNSSSNVGYVTGGTVSSTDDITNHIWGAANGGMRLNAFYRYSFDRKDLRENYTVGMWYYDAEGLPQVRTDYSTHNNKWSKLWANSSAALGNNSKDKTGINYPYMRYADILLMYAEAVNEVEEGVNGPNGAKAINALKEVRSRAFAADDQSEKVDEYISAAAGSKELFFQAVAEERKWELGGENMRWKDLVRWNLYSKVIYDSFMEYYIVGALADGNYMDGSEKYENLPLSMFYKRIANPGDINIYPNTSLQIIEFYNLWESVLHPGAGWNMADFYAWGDENTEYPKAQCLYSFRGYIKGGPEGNWENMNPNNLPPVRYILPIPNYTVQMSNGLYKNYYGYN
ncbi:RagB/SusD family nutrient uptake outer membrane protein [Gaoshiqia sp. Z1-71]|uniref:RagB/SusD family nutrient uptake outer membrane protein n=1 Tax=Gaoshiqia hydrogeniformans TaxID=3290090 RepID=UPI003BF8572F